MSHQGVARTLCPILVLVLAIACEKGDGRATNDAQPAAIDPDAPTQLAAEGASKRTTSDEPATKRSELDARLAETGSGDRVAAGPREQKRSRSEDNWLDHVADLEPVGAEANELRKLAVLHPDPEVRKSALEELAEANHELALKSLVISLEDDDLEVVALAIKQLRSLDDRAAIEPLDRLTHSHTDEKIQAAALRAIEFLE